MMKKKLTENEYKILTALLSEGRDLRYSEIRKICATTDPTLTKYLNKLYNEGYILRKESRMKREYPHPVFYNVKNDITTFEKLVNIFIGSLEEHTFHSSSYCQSAITPDFLRKLEQRWKIDFEFRNKAEEKELKDPKYFTEKDILKILRDSPTALKNALDGPRETNGRHQLENILLTSLVLDVSIGKCRNSTDLCSKTDVGVKIYGPTKQELFFKKCEIEIDSILCKVPYREIPEAIKGPWTCPKCGNQMFRFASVCGKCDQITPLGEIYFK